MTERTNRAGMADCRVGVGFDLRLISRDEGGIRSHALNLFRALVLQSSEFRLTGIVDSQHGAELVTTHLRGIAGWRLVTVPYGPYSPQSQFLLPRLARQQGFGIIHFPDFWGMLRRTELKTVIIVHDLIPFTHPELCSRSLKVRFHGAYRAILRQALRVADAVTVVSQTTRKDMCRDFPGVADRLTVIHSGIEDIFFAPAGGRPLNANRWSGLSHPFVMFVGRRVPNKNVVPLIRAIDVLRRRGRPATLLLVGPGDKRYREPEDAVASLSLADRVHFAGFVATEELKNLYHAADVFVFPSSYEGFGAPPAEAMASGTPVVTSARSSLPEVVGDAAVFVEPESPESIADGIQRLLDDPDLRAKLIARGRERARQFTWSSAAEKVLEVYRRLAPGRMAQSPVTNQGRESNNSRNSRT
jgi:glycosyltransferase involved in cell wall biosynthesis